jgi:hypothetical protein
MTRQERHMAMMDQAKESIRAAEIALSSALAHVTDELSDEAIRLTTEALLHLGEARGWRNAASDVRERLL